MKSFKILVILCAAVFSSVPLSAQDDAAKVDKIGTVNIQKLVGEYYKSAEIRESFKVYEKEIQAESESRIEAIKLLVTEARKLAKEGEDPSLARAKKEELFKNASAKNQEAQALARDRQEWAERKNSALSEKANVEFSILRSEVVAFIQKVAEEQGYDFILDLSGSSGARVPILSYSKDATDLTAVLLESLNKEAPVKDE